MRYLAVGDIHGCFQALRTLAAAVPFASDDVVITLGDYVDRGPDSCAVLDWLIHRGRRGKLVALRGNHEVMMLRAREDEDRLKDLLFNGGDKTLQSYSPFGDTGRLVDVPDHHWDFLETQTRPWFETERHFFVHGNALPDYAFDEQPDFMIYWGAFNDPKPHESGKIMVCGHTPQKAGKPKNVGHAVCIDTWAYGGGWLTCLDIETGCYWQANQRGESRVRFLNDSP